MSPCLAWRRWLPLVLAGIALATLLLAGAGDPYDHDHGGEGLYDPGCDLLALATLGTAGVPAVGGFRLSLPIVVAPVLLVLCLSIGLAPRTARRSRAPPRPST